MERQYVGIGLHRRRSVIYRMNAAGEKLECVRIDKDRVRLAAEVTKAGPGAHVVVEATYGWVRHEARLDRVGCKDPPAACRSRSLKLECSLTPETLGRAGAALTSPGRASTARSLGSGK